MGVVYMATDTMLRRTVALKVLPEQVASDPERRRLFLREARAAAAVTHPNLVTIFEVGEADGRVFLALDYIDGQSLRRRLDEGRLSVGEALRIAGGLARGMARAHEAGIVHRDLKPDNVMIAKDGLIKVLDFGIARIAPKADPSEPTGAGAVTGALTLEGRVVGTPGYMSPEQARGKPVDVTTDVFAFGVVLYEMLAGRRPYVGESASDVLAALLRDDPPPLRDASPEVSTELDAVVRRCLAKVPTERYLDCGEVVRALDALPEGASSKSLESDARVLGADGASDANAIASLGSATTGFATSHPSAGPAKVVKAKEGAAAARRLPRGALVGVLAVALVGAGVGVAHWRSPTVSSAPSSSASAMTSSAPPVSTSPEAARDYAEGLAALRGANWPRADGLFRRTLATDPDCTSAALALLLMARYLPLEQDTERYRNLYRSVDARRSRLSERDRMVLDAVQPLIVRQPPDAKLMGERLVAASERFPDDALVAFFAAVASEAHAAVVLPLADRVLALDPDYLDAMQLRARALLQLGRVDEGMRQLDECIAKSPGAQCAGDRVFLLMAKGQCADAEAAGKAYVGDSVGSDEAYEYFAWALSGNGAGDAAVAEAIHQSAAKRPPEVGAIFEASMLVRLDVLRGHFASADRRTAELMKLVERNPDATWHLQATALRAALLAERGDRAGLTALANDFFERRRVWNRGGSDLGTARLLAAVDEAEALPHAEVVGKAEAWFEENQTSRSPRWLLGGLGSRTARSADEAKGWLERTGPLPASSELRDEPSVRANVGRAMLIAGDAAGAANALATAAGECNVLVDPFTSVPARLWLGQAREALGDTASACAAYDEVLRRWGTEKPLVATAKAAEARRTALHCP